MNDLKILIFLFNLKFKKRVFTINKYVDNFFLLAILLILIFIGAYTGILLKQINTIYKYNYSFYFLITLTIFFYLFQGIFPGFKKMNSTLLINCFPIKNIQKVVLIFFNEISTVRNLILTTYLLSISIYSIGITKNWFFLSFIISIIILNFFLRLIINIPNKKLKKYSCISIIYLLFIDFVYLFFNLNNKLYLFFLICFFFIFPHFFKKIQFAQAEVYNRKINQKYSYDIKNTFLKNSNLKLIGIFTIITKSIFIILISISLYKFILGYKLFLLILFTPLVWFNYILNNLIGINPEFYINNILSPYTKKSLLLTITNGIFKICLVDFILTVVLYTICSTIPFGKFEISQYSLIRLLIFYFEVLITLYSFSLISSFIFFRTVNTKKLFSKNSTNPYSSLISISITVFFSLQLYFSSTSIAIFFLSFSCISAILLLKLFSKIFNDNKISIIEKFKS